MSELQISEHIQSGREYYWKRTEGWDWFGTPRWWEVFIEFRNGWNGGGGLVCEERWRWNGSIQNISTKYRNLTYEQSVNLVEELEKNIVPPPPRGELWDLLNS